MDNVTFSDKINKCIDSLVKDRDFGVNREQVIMTLVHDALLYDDKMRCIIKVLLLEGASDDLIFSTLPGGDRKKRRILEEQHRLLDEILKKRETVAE